MLSKFFLQLAQFEKTRNSLIQFLSSPKYWIFFQKLSKMQKKFKKHKSTILSPQSTQKRFSLVSSSDNAVLELLLVLHGITLMNTAKSEQKSALCLLDSSFFSLYVNMNNEKITKANAIFHCSSQHDCRLKIISINDQ